MNTRVWRQLLDATVVQHEHDAVLRLALGAMAADRTSPLTTLQRQWIIALAGRTTRLTAHERARLKEPLLAYIKNRMPRCLDIVQQQFPEGEAHGHDQSDPR